MTTTNLQEIVPNSHGQSTPKGKTSLFPTTLREGARGRGFSREAASLASPHRLPMPHGRGGSVSRRDLNQLAKNRAQLAWALNSKGKDKPIPSYSSGGSAREGLLLEKPPPSHPPHRLPTPHGRGGSVSRRDLNQLAKIAPTSQGRTVCRSHQLEPQPLFGRGGLGERRFS